MIPVNGQSCATCRFYSADGVCCAHPPVASAFYGGQSDADGMPIIVTGQAWPFVADDDWCGEWKSAESGLW